MKRLLFVAALAGGIAVGIGACSDMFSPPELPDLYKSPYDFAVPIPPFKGGDMAEGATDLAGQSPADMASTD